MKSKITLLCLIAILLTMNSINAQEPGAIATGPNSVITDEDALAAWERRIPEIEFLTGPASDVARELGHHFPEVNFVMPKGDLAFFLDLQLRAVSLGEILKALEMTTEGQIQSRMETERLVTFQVRSRPQTNGSKPVLRAFNLQNYLRMFPSVDPQTGAVLPKKEEQEKDRERRIFQLHEALQASFDMMRRANPNNENIKMPEIDIHSEPALLIVVGTPESLKVVDQIVGALIGQEKKLQPDLLDVYIE
jgi:hypothetical protein